jgi:photosystem II stability/assembly factor-like uncharacterized protein
MYLRLLLLIFTISSVATAQQTWTDVGPAPLATGGSEGNVSGRITAIAAHPSDVNRIYIAAAGGGVWRTTDGGSNWSPLTDSQATTSMGAIAIAPGNPDVIYAGTGEANGTSDTNFGRGILISRDGGNTWTLSTGPGAFDRLTTAKIVVDPTNSNVAYAAIAAHAKNTVAGTGNTGIWKTTNGGATWTKTTTAISETDDDWLDVAINPANPQILYASLHTESDFLTGPRGVYKSTNGGSTWSLLTNAPNGSTVLRISIAIAPTNPQVVYVSASSPGSGSLAKFMRSDDGGATFTDLTSGTPNYLGSTGYYNTTLIVDPSNAATVYAGGVSLIRSMDGGVSWTDITSDIPPPNIVPDVSHHGIAFDAWGRLLDGNDGGIYRLDAPPAPIWRDLNGNLQTIQFYSIGLHPTDPNKMLGGTQHEGVAVYSGNVLWTRTGGGTAFYAKFSSTNGNRAYYYSIGDGLYRSDNGGFTWLSKSPTDSAANIYAPFAVDPANGDRVVFGGGRVWETTSGGDSWTAISPAFNFLSAVAIAPSDGNTIYAGKGASIFVTTNHGASWTQHDLPTSGLGINDIQVDPDNSQIAYAVPAGFFNNLGTAHHVYRTTDGGNTWTDISGNLPNEPAWSIQIDPTTSPKTLYLGVDDGVFFTTEGRTTWTRFGTGLPAAQVLQLDFNKTLHLLGAATHGRSAWIIHTWGFTDDPLVPNTTIIRAVHVNELRSRIDSLRQRYGLSAFNWTDPNLSSGQTIIRAVHLTDLRSALDAAYIAAGRVTPTYTDTVVGGINVKAVHFNELRGAVVNLERTP